jgi:epoxyqueuosine reductase
MIPKNAYFPIIETELSKLAQEEELELVGLVSDFEKTGEKRNLSDSLKATFEDYSPANGILQEESHYKSWLDHGFHGEMKYLESHQGLKFHPERILDNCKSVILFGLNYFQKRPNEQSNEGKIARFAWGRDYHKELGYRLKRIAKKLADRFPNEQFRNFTDSGPLHERFFAEQAMLGYTGRHTLLISSAYGSWLVLGHILSTKRFITLDQQTTVSPKIHGACPSSCFKCGEICPTGALRVPYTIDANKCISYLTIEYKGAIPLELREKMGNWIFGCDLCQEVCPLNVRAQLSSVPGFKKAIAGSSIDIKEILSLKDDSSFTKRFAGSPLMRPGRQLMQRNALVAAGNSGDLSLIPMLKNFLHSDPLISEQANWSLKSLKKLSKDSKS